MPLGRRSAGSRKYAIDIIEIRLKDGRCPLQEEGPAQGGTASSPQLVPPFFSISCSIVQLHKLYLCGGNIFTEAAQRIG